MTEICIIALAVLALAGLGVAGLQDKRISAIERELKRLRTGA